MRLHLQRVSRAQVDVDGTCIGKIQQGLLVLAGFGAEDSQDLPKGKVWASMLNKVLDLRIFPDENDKMNLSLRDFGGELLVVSQFTLYADCRKGRRPSFNKSAPGAEAKVLYEQLLQDFEQRLPGQVQHGEFGAMMDVSLCNWGPVTLLLDSADLF